MCGISGIIYNKSPKKTEKFKSSANLQKHRGPDYTGYFGDKYVDLMHHRLSIIDLDSRSHQPYTNPNKNRVLVYNGEIYNYKDLIKKYQLHVTTKSDTEVLFELLKQQNFDINELNGIFAFAHYNLNTQKINLLRDRLGVKPLYYYHSDDLFMFASEAKVIYNYLDNLSINNQALLEYLTFGHSNSDNTIIKGVKKLTPGTHLSLDIKTFKIRQEQFWTAEHLAKSKINHNYSEAKNRTGTLLEQAIKRQCMSDVPVGAYLSGGIDSSTIVALASKYTETKLQTYSVNFEQSDASELKLAKLLANKCGTEHYEFEVSVKDFDETLTRLVYQYDEPFADAAIIPLHFMASKASLSSKVVLQGDGGDEIFGGYGRHLDLQQYKLKKYSFLALKYLSPNQNKRASYARRYERLHHSDQAKLMAHMVERDALFENDRDFIVTKSQIFNKEEALQSYKESNKRYAHLPLMQRMLYTDVENILRYKYLEKVDKVNMFHSIEARVPFLDNALIDYVMRLPQSYKIRKGVTKSLLRDIMIGKIPKEILNHKKMSFGTPVLTWLTTNLYNFTLCHFENAKDLGLPFDYAALISDLKLMKQGHFTEKSNLVWKHLILTIWIGIYAHKIKKI